MRNLLQGTRGFWAGLFSLVLVFGIASSVRSEEKVPYKDRYAIVVSKTTQDDEQWGPVVTALQRKYRARIFTYTNGFDDIKKALSDFFPRYVCFVAKPGELGAHVITISYLGVRTNPINDDLVKYLKEASLDDLLKNRNLPNKEGLYVIGADDGSPAARGGITPGDVLLEIDGKKVLPSNLGEIIRAITAGNEASVKLYRKGEEKTLKVTIGKREVDKELGGEITFINAAHKLMTSLDDDPYEDAIWAILTGYEASDAMRIINAPPLTVRHGLSHVGGGWLESFEDGLSWSEGEKNAKFVKVSGKEEVEKVAGPDDTTQEVVEALNKNQYDIMSTSGHATQSDWQMGYSYKNGQIRSDNGTLFALDSAGKRYEIKTSNSKIYYSPGNCLIGNISHRGCMALAWIHNGANQFFGHIVEQTQPCHAWSIADYFFGLQDRFTYAEAVYINWVTMEYELSQGKKYPCCTAYGEGRGNVLYGDPAWVARMKKTVMTPYDQTLTVTPIEKGKKLKIVFKIKANKETAIPNPSVALLTTRIKNFSVEETDAKKVVVTDNFILMSVWEDKDSPLSKGDERTATIIAEPAE